MTKKFSDLKPQVVLGVAAHPDDLDFGAAGSLAKFAAAGAKVYYLLLTDGSKGSADQSISSERLVKIRQAEQRAAIQAIGATQVDFLDYPDGGLEVTMGLKQAIVRTIRQYRPDVVVTMDPSVLYAAELGLINHPDHRAAGQATLDAVFPLARDHLSFPELFADGFQPHKVATLLLINFNTSNYHINITETIDSKIAALRAHTSQMPDMVKVEEQVRSMATAAGAATGYQYAEAFVRIDIPG